MKEIVCSICNEEMDTSEQWVSGRSDSCIVVVPCCNREDTTESIEVLRNDHIDEFSETFAALVSLTTELLKAVNEDENSNLKYDVRELLVDLKDTVTTATSEFEDIYQFINKEL